MQRDDRRMFDRFNAEFPCEIKPSGAKRNSPAQCYDVSASGISIFTEDYLTPNANCEISLKFPDGHRPFQGVARVVWSKKLEAKKRRNGLEFKKLDLLGLRRIFSAVSPHPYGRRDKGAREG